jgi:hypothetical protein
VRARARARHDVVRVVDTATAAVRMVLRIRRTRWSPTSAASRGPPSTSRTEALTDDVDQIAVDLLALAALAFERVGQADVAGRFASSFLAHGPREGGRNAGAGRVTACRAVAVGGWSRDRPARRRGRLPVGCTRRAGRRHAAALRIQAPRRHLGVNNPDGNWLLYIKDVATGALAHWRRRRTSTYAPRDGRCENDVVRVDYRGSLSTSLVKLAATAAGTVGGPAGLPARGRRRRRVVRCGEGVGTR